MWERVFCAVCKPVSFMSTKGSVSYHSCLAGVFTSDAGDTPLQLWESHFYFSLQLCQFLPYNYFGSVVRFIYLSKCYIFMIYWSFYHLPPVIFSLLPTKYFFLKTIFAHNRIINLGFSCHAIFWLEFLQHFLKIHPFYSIPFPCFDIILSALQNSIQSTTSLW